MTSTQIVGTPSALRQAINGRHVGLVPTMGALHAGHVALIEQSARENDVTVVSIFVNPTQFENEHDLARYPRFPEQDVAVAGQAGAQIIYAPSVETIYPAGFGTTVTVGEIGDVLEGADRRGHFAAVATVVSILLNTARPTRSYFGEKDFQQLAVIRQVHRDLALPGAIVPCTTVRESDGLAMSSRNVRLGAEDRNRARAIPESLFAMQRAFGTGIRTSDELLAVGRSVLDQDQAIDIRYLTVVDPQSLLPVETCNPSSRVLIAATVGGVRLIDNMPLGAERQR